MPKKVLSPKYFIRRCEHLLRSADRLKEDAASMVIKDDADSRAYSRKMCKAEVQYREATTINMMLDTMEEYGNEEVKAIIAKEKEKS